MLGVPVKPTIKEVADDMMVVKTLDRSRLWDVQTPQACYLQLQISVFSLLHTIMIRAHAGDPPSSFEGRVCSS